MSKPASELTYSVLRIVAGAMFALHGLPKLFGVLGKAAQPVGSQLWIGGVIELVCGVLIMVGLFTRFAAFLASGTMAVAYFQYHWKGDFADWQWLPMVNKGELAALYSFYFLFVVTYGPGRWAFDKK